MENNSSAQPSDYSKEAQDLINLDGLIKNYLSRLQELRDQLRESREQLEDMLINDLTYHEQTEKAKEAGKSKNQTKSQLLKQPLALELAEKLKSSREEVKDIQQSLSDYLLQYQRLTGANEFEDKDGNVREIKYTVKLVKKSLGR